jgi:hypothetical protein
VLHVPSFVNTKSRHGVNIIILVQWTNNSSSENYVTGQGE